MTKQKHLCYSCIHSWLCIMDRAIKDIEKHAVNPFELTISECKNYSPNEEEE